MIAAIQLEKGERLPKIEFSQKNGVEEICKECEKRFTIYLHEMDGIKWFKGECKSCGNRITLTPKQCDLIQPSSKLFKLYYEDDPFESERKKQKEREMEKENLKQDREDNLRLKVKQGLLKPWEVGDVKSYVRERNLE